MRSAQDTSKPGIVSVKWTNSAAVEVSWIGCAQRVMEVNEVVRE